MKLELKENMYYTRSGKGKLGLCKEGNYTPEEYVKHCQQQGYDVIKASYNIMDLIEVGDILSYKHSAINKIYKEVINNKVTLEIFRKYFSEKSLELISVVTHEQFENMEYRIGE